MLSKSIMPLVLVAVVAANAVGGETVQLPTFSFSTVNTTVTAPDGGTTLLGGVSRLSEGATTRGVPILGKVPGLNRLFKNRGIGRSVQGMNMSVTPRIIILEEEEEKQVGRILAARRGGTPEAPFPPPYAAQLAYQRRAEMLARQISAQRPPDRRFETLSAAHDDPLAEFQAIRRKNELAQQQRDEEAVRFFDQGETAEAEGKKGAAKIYYKMAARRATGAFKQQIEARLQALGN